MAHSTHPRDLSPVLIAFLAFACTLVAAGSYFAQPLSGVIAPSIGLAPWAAGLMITMSQLGYCLGLLLVSPLGDLLENRRLLLVTLSATVFCLLVAGLAGQTAVFLSACFGIGACAVAVQLIVVMAASMTPAHKRGRTVGQVTAGLLFGVLLAWPVANVINNLFGWRVLFLADALLIALLAVALRLILPIRRAPNGLGYRSLIASLLPLWRAHPQLRRRALTQALLFGVFSLFWTTAPMELRTRHDVSPTALALFGLVGAGGALAAPLAGWAADRGLSARVSLAGGLAVMLSCLLFALNDSLPALMLAAFFISAGVQACHVVAQRCVLVLQPDAANRLNSLYIATFFAGGALGSSLASPLFLAGWFWPAVLGVVAASLASVSFLHLHFLSSTRFKGASS